MAKPETLEDVKERYVWDKDIELLDSLGRCYELQVVDIHEAGGQGTSADDQRSLDAYELSQRIEDARPRASTNRIGRLIVVELDGAEQGLLDEARRVPLYDIPEQRAS